MIRTIIVDDEEHCIDRLSCMVAEDYSDSILLMDTAKTVEEGLTAIKKLQPDLVFLDVHIQDKTGFDLLNQLNQINFSVIFTTAYDKYAVQAFKFSAIDYLLKPVDPDDLKQAVYKLQEKIDKDEIARKMEVLFYNLKHTQNVAKRISIPTVNGFVFVQVNDIIRCQSEINYTTIFLTDKQKLTVAKTLKEFEELLGDYNFFRVHNSHLINLVFIKSYNKGKGGSVTMTDHSEVEVSTRRKDEFLKKLASF